MYYKVVKLNTNASYKIVRSFHFHAVASLSLSPVFSAHSNEEGTSKHTHTHRDQLQHSNSSFSSKNRCFFFLVLSVLAVCVSIHSIQLFTMLLLLLLLVFLPAASTENQLGFVFMNWKVGGGSSSL